MSHSLARYFGTSAILVLAIGCGGGDGHPSGVERSAEVPKVEPTSGDNDRKPAGPCAEGTTRSCTITLVTLGNVKNCFVGEQMCVDGAFGDCYDPAHPPAAEKKQSAADEPADDEPGADDEETEEPEDNAGPDEDDAEDPGNDGDSDDDDSTADAAQF